MSANTGSASRPTAALGAIDLRIETLSQGAGTLAPGRKRATPLAQLVANSSGTNPAHLAASLVAITEAELQAFPGNLFWDFDYFVASIDLAAAATDNYARTLDQITESVVTLLESYGQDSPIRFQYVHDFMYGFDWARWVSRDPEQRAHIAPFDIEFLRSSESRATELLQWIGSDHERYPTLADDAWRNPFPFPREPSAEGILYRDLAARDMVPVAAWDPEARPRWDRNYDELRDERAAALRLVPASAGHHEGAP